MAANLRPAEELIGPRVAEMVAAYDCPAADAPLVALARTLAATIDAMPPGVRTTMLPQHSGQLTRVLAELDARAARRAKPQRRAQSQLDLLRAEQARNLRGRGA
jgi:hypothetical protein